MKRKRESCVVGFFLFFFLFFFVFFFFFFFLFPMYLTLSRLGEKFSILNDILKYLSYFFQKSGSDIPCKLSPWETISIKCQSLFPEKKVYIYIRKMSSIFPSVELAQRVLKIKPWLSETSCLGAP